MGLAENFASEVYGLCAIPALALLWAMVLNGAKANWKMVSGSLLVAQIATILSGMGLVYLFYRQTQELNWVAPFLGALAFIGVSAYLLVQAALERKLIVGQPLAILISLFRYYSGIGLGLSVYVISVVLAGSGLISLAKLLQVSEINRELLLWLKTPIGIFAGLAASELCAGFIARVALSSSAEKREENKTLDRVVSDLKMKALKIRWVSSAGSPLRVFRTTTGFKSSTLWISPELLKEADSKQIHFLFAREDIAQKKKRAWEKIKDAAFYSAILTLPYLLLAQAMLYLAPESWSVAGSLGLYAGLFLAQKWIQSARARIYLREDTWPALREADLNLSEVRAHSLSLSGKFAEIRGVPMILGFPRAWQDEFASVNEDRVSARGMAKHPRAFSLLILALALAVVWQFALKNPFALRRAAEAGDLGEIGRLSTRGVSVDSIDLLANGMFPLLAACGKKQIEAVKLLLEKKADPNQMHRLGLFPLLIASEQGSLEIVDALLQAGAKVNLKGLRGYTPLMMAAIHGNLEVAERLIAKGASLNARSKHRSTALMLAISNNQDGVALRLIQAGASVLARDMDGDSAFDIAGRRHKTELISIMLKVAQSGAGKGVSRTHF